MISFNSLTAPMNLVPFSLKLVLRYSNFAWNFDTDYKLDTVSNDCATLM